MKKYIILILFAVVLLSTGCKNSACYSMLEKVDSLTELDLTDSAGIIIKEVESTYDIKEGKERAYYSLLKYQLQFRNKDIDINDSLINYSISYYLDNMDERKLALSYYLKARMSDDKEALKCLKKAEFIAEKTEDSFLKMRILHTISYINIDKEDDHIALEYEKRALELCKYIHDNEANISCLINLSKIYSNLGQLDSSLYYANKGLSYLSEAPNRQKAAIYLNLAASLENTDTARAREYASKSIEYRPSNNAYQVLAKLARDQKNYRLSEEYLTEALKYCESMDWEVFVLYEMAKTKDLMGKHKEASQLSQRVMKLNDSLEDVRAQDSIKEILIAADHEHRKETEISRKDDRAMAGAAVMMLVIVAVCTAYTVKRYRYRKSIDTMQTQARRSAQRMERKTHSLEKKAEKYRQEIKEIKEKSREKDREISSLDAKIKRIEERHDVLLAKKKQVDEERMRTGMEVYDALKRGDKVSGWTKEKMECLVMFFTFAYPDVMKTLTERHGTMTEYRCTQLIMKHLGLTTRQISEQFGITGNAVRAMMSRKK